MGQMVKPKKLPRGTKKSPPNKLTKEGYISWMTSTAMITQ